MKGYIQFYRDNSPEQMAMETELKLVAQALNLDLKVEIGYSTPYVAIYLFSTFTTNDEIVKFLDNFKDGE